eukprot:4578963-Pyramimonas_sp.AAC.1
MPQEASGGHRKPQETTGGPKRLQETPESPRRFQEAPGGPWRMRRHALVLLRLIHTPHHPQLDSLPRRRYSNP